MADDRKVYEFSYALYSARQVDPESAQMLVKAAEAGLIGIEQATEALTCLAGKPPVPQRYNRRSTWRLGQRTMVE